MKETELFTADKVAIHKQNAIKKATNHVGFIKPHAGHTCFEINVKTGAISPAKFEESTMTFAPNGNGMVRRKVVIQPDCLYVSALNKKNAIKKLQKLNKPQLA